MKPRSVEIGRGLFWLTEGWRLFSREPGIWIVLGTILFAVTIVLSFIPIIGYMIGFLITPMLVAGMVFGAVQVKSRRTLSVEHLFKGFHDQKKTGALLRLGVVMLGAAV